MLHHYNYSNSLSHFLSYHQLDDQTDPSSHTLCEDLSQQEDPRCRSNSSASNNKSFTIAAILGLKNENQDDAATDLSVVNLSVHHHPTGTDRSLVSNCNRLQLPIRHTSSTVTHYSHGCPQRQTGLNLR